MCGWRSRWDVPFEIFFQLSSERIDILTDECYLDNDNLGMKIQSEVPIIPKVTCNTMCVKWIKNWLPVNMKKEIIQIAKLGGPVMICQLMVFLINFVSTAFCGHLGKTELAGVSLATAMISVTGISVGIGLSSACDTLMSQTYGSGNLKLVGVILQRGIFILLLACFPCWALLINTENILLAVKQQPKVARFSQLYVKVFMPALPASFMYQLQGKYLQNQGIVWPQVITGVVGNVVNGVANYILLYVLNMGVVGSAAANALTQFIMAAVLCVYIYCLGLHKATWSGWSLKCLEDWDLFVKIAIPSMLMFCLEIWTFEIGALLAGLISETELGAQSVIHQLVTVVFVCPYGYLIAASVLVGHALGAGNAERAIAAGKATMICALASGCFIGIILCSCKNVIGFIFSKEKEIVQRVGHVMIIYGLLHPIDAITVCAGGIIRGAGQQKVGAVINLLGYYGLCLPVGASLMFAAKMGIMGLWLGICIGVISQGTFFIIFLWRLNWKKAADEAMLRAGVLVTEKKEMMPMENTGHGSTAQTVNVNAFDSPSPEVCNSDLENIIAAEPRAPLGWRLVVRRVLILLVMLLILAFGIFTSEFLPKLLK